MTSPRNSPEAHRSLFDHLECQTLITSDPVAPTAQTVLDIVKPAHHLKVPSLTELLTPRHKSYHFTKTSRELQNSPFVIMCVQNRGCKGLADLIKYSRQTSGTTGLPKPIVWTHETCNQVLNAKTQRTPDGTLSVDGTFVKGKRVIMTLPPFHVRMIALVSYYPSTNGLY